MKHNYDTDDIQEAFPADAYRVRQYPGIAFYVRGWHTEPDQDTEWTGMEEKTGKIATTMIGDDRIFLIDPDDLEELPRADYCSECGQIGCSHDGLDRSEELDPGQRQAMAELNDQA